MQNSMLYRCLFYYRDTDHLWNVLNGSIGDELLTGLEKSDFIGIGWFDGRYKKFLY